MSTVYNYIITDFPNGINTGKLYHEITMALNPDFHISIHNDIINIIFDVALSAGELTILDGIISSFTPSWIIPGSKNLTFSIDTKTTSSISFITMGCTSIPEGNISITGVSLISAVPSADHHYDIQVCDLTTDDVICSGQFNNTGIETVQELTFLQQPTNPTNLVVKGKVANIINPLTIYDVKLFYN